MRGRYLDRHLEAQLEALIKEQREKANTEASITRDDPQAKPTTPSRPRRLGSWQGLVEQRIQDAFAEGAFDDLPGAGKPLDLDDDMFVPDELKMAHRMLKSSGITPLWIELNKEIRADLAGLARLRATAHERWARSSDYHREQMRADYQERIARINTKISSHNVIAPGSQVHLAALLPDEELRKFDTLVGY